LDQLTIETIDGAPVLNLSGHENGMLVIGRNKLWALTDKMRQQITDFQVTDAFYDPFDGGRLYVLRGKNLFSVNWNGIDELTGKLSLVTGQESIVSTDAPYGLTQVLVFEDELALAVLTDQGLSIYRDGGFEHLSVPDQDQNIPIRAVSSNSGQTFLATSVGISAIETGQVQHDLSGRAYDLLTDVSQGVTFVARGNRLDVVEHATADEGSRWFAGIAATELALAPDGSLISNDGLTVVRIRRGTTEVQELFTADQTVVGDRAAGPVRSILAAKDGSVWATAGASLFHWQDGQELIEFTLFKHDPAFDVHSDMLSTVFETVSGDIMLVASSEGHRNYRKSTMNGGLFRYNGVGFDLVDDTDVLGRWFVSGYTDLGDGTALAGTTGGFSRHNGHKFEELDLLNDSSYLKLKERLPSLFLGTRGAKLGKDLWLFGTAGGIVAYSGGAWIYPDRLNWMLPGQEYASYGSRTVHAVETDPIGRIYVATDFGLTIYDPKGASAENFLIRQNRGNSAFETLEKRRMGEVADVLLDALPDDSDAAKLAEKLEKSRKALADLERRLDTANQLNDPQASKLKKASIRAKQRNIGLLAELEAKAPVLFSMLQLNPLDLQSMSGRLPDDLVVAQFLPTADRLFINLVSSKGTEVREVEVTADALFSTTLSVVKSMALGAKGAKSVVGFSLSPTTPTAHAVDGVLTQQLAWLYDQLLRPIEHAVSDGQTLVISPVGVLSNLPFNALVSDMSDDTPKYAVQSWPIAVAPSLYALNMMMSHTNSYSTNHVVFGDPDGSLPGARAEAEEIAAILEPDTVELRQGEEATYDELLFYAEDARFLHLATHGKLDHKSPRNSYLLLAEGRRLNLPQIMTLPLENTDLVFLSACETGIGTDGLEYRTIAHAFAHAGAPAVVASFWQVEDSATKQLALAFYESKMDGLENSAALAAAQNSMIQAGGENAHPNRWASFAVFGKP
ncbi:MAG: CHAT domain-containing protein, partial [Amylibacter sp.]